MELEDFLTKEKEIYDQKSKLEKDVDIIIASLNALQNEDFLNELSDNDIRDIAWKLNPVLYAVLMNMHSRELTWAFGTIPMQVINKMKMIMGCE